MGERRNGTAFTAEHAENAARRAPFLHGEDAENARLAAEADAENARLAEADAEGGLGNGKGNAECRTENPETGSRKPEREARHHGEILRRFAPQDDSAAGGAF
jgi:hypothetical protein